MQYIESSITVHCLILDNVSDSFDPLNVPRFRLWQLFTCIQDHYVADLRVIHNSPILIIYLYLIQNL